MANNIVRKWRESASLIILAKDKCLQKHKFDYNVMLFNRPAKSSFMPNSWVFPGGVCEPADESAKWLDYFKSFGICETKLTQLTDVNGQRSNIFKTDSPYVIPKEISLRVSAIRETFEEVGIFLCCNRKSLDDQNGYGNYLNNFNVAHWQRLIHDDPSKFLTLCKEMDVIPDLWSLYEWSAWLTPASLKKRFVTAFFMVALSDVPNVVIEQNEVSKYAWKSPMDYLQAAHMKDLWLPPPQSYELARLLHFNKLEEAKNFARDRSNKGTVLMLPVLFKCIDGNVHVLPGDDLYPVDPNSIEDFVETGLTITKFREGAKKLHRSEHVRGKNFVFQLNFDLENGHISPVSLSKH